MGLEPTTFCMASRRSSQLSYIRVGPQYSLGLGVQGLVDEAVGQFVMGPPDGGVPDSRKAIFQLRRLLPEVS